MSRRLSGSSVKSQQSGGIAGAHRPDRQTLAPQPRLGLETIHVLQPPAMSPPAVRRTFNTRNQTSQVVSMAVVVATGITANGDREILGCDIGDSEDETFWRGFLRSPVRST